MTGTHDLPSEAAHSALGSFREVLEQCLPQSPIHQAKSVPGHKGL